MTNLVFLFHKAPGAGAMSLARGGRHGNMRSLIGLLGCLPCLMLRVYRLIHLLYIPHSSLPGCILLASACARLSLCICLTT
ncbi:hypothetical protein BO99DRAFT_150977 [Aspergillus violaceofuscus CBS 115571]|uniref:Uncharacterized protein n=1 Tax=Aspergillus violaceofuscus (strain CBS 115571) TaxID=1450538 RepID=A0A2V5HNK5_ASPV1|nr:hypothetical protein BO99DRAFT_150977 [Aspergillus violaceofuscus CBS 115571]